MRRTQQAELLTHRGGRVADLVDGLLQFFPGNTERLGPVFDLVVLVHVDLGAVRLVTFGQVVHDASSDRINAVQNFLFL